MARGYGRYVIARPQTWLSERSTQCTHGFDQRSVVGHGRTLKAAAERAGQWAFRSGYRVFDSRTSEDLGELAYEECGGYYTIKLDMSPELTDDPR